jgi:hypothetical protein
MDPGIRSPLVDFFRRGDVARDVRLQAAQGALAPRAIDQLALLLVLLDDGDPEVARSASATIDRLPQGPLSSFLANPDVSTEMRTFFAARGSSLWRGTQTDEPLIDDGQEAVPEGPPNEDDLSVAAAGADERHAAGQGGHARPARERSILIRDPNRLVLGRRAQQPESHRCRGRELREDGQRQRGSAARHRHEPAMDQELRRRRRPVRNPKTPVASPLTLLQRVNDKDVRILATDRNILRADPIARGSAPRRRAPDGARQIACCPSGRRPKARAGGAAALGAFFPGLAFGVAPFHSRRKSARPCM